MFIVDEQSNILNEFKNNYLNRMLSLHAIFWLFSTKYLLKVSKSYNFNILY